MKKYLSLVMIGLSLMLSGCNKDDNNDPNTPPTGDTGKVRYEATVSDPENFKLLIHYTVGVDISSVKIFIDDKLHKSNSGENYAMVQHIFGQENYQ